MPLPEICFEGNVAEASIKPELDYRKTIAQPKDAGPIEALKATETQILN
jgi:hypothetical protein